jgi:hypothetical protein
MKSTVAIKNWLGQNVNLAAGKYSAEAQMTANGGTFVAHTQSGDLSFQVPQLVADEQGNINASAGQIGQVFGLSGKIWDVETNFDRVRDEQCVLGTHDDCEWEENRHGSEDYVCNTVVDYGSQSVHEVGYSTTKNISINLVESKTIGTFTGSYGLGDTTNEATPLTLCQ